MALSVLTAFAQFLSSHKYSTSMWENGYGWNEANEVCHELTTWAQSVLELPGEFLVLWSDQEETKFFGDNELGYALEGVAYLLPSPFIEGDSEGFVTALQRIIHGGLNELYAVDIRGRVLYNAV
jgi:hypothetical protein